MSLTLYQIRVMNKLTQEEVAKSLEISIPSWQAYEQYPASRMIPADLFIKFCTLVNVKPEDVDLKRKPKK